MIYADDYESGSLDLRDKEPLLTVRVGSWVLYSALAFVPSLSFFASMKNHGSPWLSWFFS